MATVLNHVGGKNIQVLPGWHDGAAGKLYLAYLRDCLATGSARCTAADHTRFNHWPYRPRYRPCEGSMR